MKRVLCVILTLCVCGGLFPPSIFATDDTLYTATVDVISTECGFDTCQVYIYDDDCYMNIDDIVRYTRSNYKIDENILKINHGNRTVNIDLTSNTLTEEGITYRMETLRNNDTVIVHAYPFLTYMGATCSTTEGKLIVDMPECTIWEGIIQTGNENDITIDVFGGESEQKFRLILNGILSILQSDLAHASGLVNRREATLLTTQVELSKYLSNWDRKTIAEEKQIDLFSKAVETREFTEVWEDDFENSNVVYGITLDVVENTLDNPKVFREFKECWEDDIKIASIGLVLLKNLSNNKKAAEDAAAMFNACSKHISSDSLFSQTVLGLKDELYSDTQKNVGAIFHTGLEVLLNEGFDELLDIGGQEISLSLSAGVLITNLLDGKKDVFAYATAETNAINLLYLKEDVIKALESLADRVRANNYSYQQDIEDYRLLASLYYRILIAINEQIEEMIVAQDRENEAEMATLISQLRANSTGFAQNLYILTMSTGKAFPNIESIGTSNKWDDDNSIMANAEKVPNGIEGLGASSLKTVLTGIEADSIQYHNCSESGNFAVIEKDGKYGIIGYGGEMILPIEYESIRRGFEFSYDYLTISTDKTGWNAYVDRDGAIAYGYPDGGGMNPSAYWYEDGIIVFDMDYGIMDIEDFYYGVSPVLKTRGFVMKQRDWNSDKLFPIRKISGYINVTEHFQQPQFDTKNFAMIDMETHELISDFIYEDIDDYNGVSEGLLAVKKDGKWGFLNEDGAVVVDFLYDPYESTTYYDETYEYVYTAVNGYISVLKDGKWGLIDTQGNIVIDISYDGISQVNPDGLVWLKENDLWSLYQLGN